MPAITSTPAMAQWPSPCRMGKLQARFNEIEFRVEPYHYEIFEFHYDLLDLHIKGAFTTDEKGNVSRLALPLEPSVKEIVFERVADPRLRDRAFLERLAGTYELMGMPLSISLKGDDTLVGTMPGQPAIELVPYRGTTFNLKGLTGASLTFQRGGNRPGRVRGTQSARRGAGGKAQRWRIRRTSLQRNMPVVSW